MSLVVIYSRRTCIYCIRAKRLLDDKGVVYKDIAVDFDPSLFEKMKQLSQARTVPQIWVGQTHVGGFTELRALERAGELDTLLRREYPG